MTEDHRRPIPWPRIIAEGVVIVASVLMALAADAWWDRRQERSEEQAALGGLEVDFLANLEELNSAIATHEGYRDDLSLLEAMTEAQLAAIPSDSVGVYVRAIAGSRTFDARDGTLDALIASGELGLIRESRLRDMLVGWRSRVQDLSEEAQQVLSQSQRVLERMGQLGGPWRIGDVETSTMPGLSEAMSHFPAANLTIAANDAELMALARTKRFLATIYLMELEAMEEHADSVLVLIASNLR